jgi:ApaG protein
MYEQETAGMIVRVAPQFLPEESRPEDNRFVWAYTIEIENRRPDPVQLMSRYWRITDENGITQEVRGDGVIGEQPRHDGRLFHAARQRRSVRHQCTVVCVGFSSRL